MVKPIIKSIVTLIVACAAIGALLYFNPTLNPFPELFNKVLKIDKTANVVSDIKKISKYTTACYYEEITLVETKTNGVVNKVVGKVVSSLLGSKPLIEDEICIIANGKVRAGYDFEKLAKDAISITGDTLEIKLPEAEIFDVVVNPSNFDVYVSDGNWTHEQVTKIQDKAKAKIEEDAKSAGIMDKAQNSGKEQLRNLFKAMGFSEVVIK